MLTLANRKLSKIFKKYPHLKEVHMNDTGKKEQVPPHIILGASDFDEINIESPRVGKLGEPLAELTEMEWVMMSRGRESDIVSALNTRASVMKNMKK